MKWIHPENGAVRETKDIPYDALIMLTLGYRPADEMPRPTPQPAPEKKPFTKEDIKPGMVCILRGGTVCIAVPTAKTEHHSHLMLVELQSDHLQGIIDEDGLTEDMRCVDNYRFYDVMKVLDLANRDGWVFEPGDIEKDRRRVLWERKEPRKVTKADIEKMFGCEVEIVDEEVQK